MFLYLRRSRTTLIRFFLKYNLACWFKVPASHKAGQSMFWFQPQIIEQFQRTTTSKPQMYAADNFVFKLHHILHVNLQFRSLNEYIYDIRSSAIATGIRYWPSTVPHNSHNVI